MTCHLRANNNRLVVRKWTDVSSFVRVFAFVCQYCVMISAQLLSYEIDFINDAFTFIRM